MDLVFIDDFGDVLTKSHVIANDNAKAKIIDIEDQDVVTAHEVGLLGRSTKLRQMDFLVMTYEMTVSINNPLRNRMFAVVNQWAPETDICVDVPCKLPHAFGEPAIVWVS